ncbi:MAG: hypothetical protein AAF961_14435, partial [Planctomycetota bacterium]
EGMSYRYYLPADYDPSIDYPLVLFLHGSGESGTDNDAQVRVHIRGLIDRTESDYPAVLVAPQLPSSVGWGPDQPIDRTSELLTQLTSELSIDENRLYLTGLSMGGFGAMRYAQLYNAEGRCDFRFAAFAPLSGAFLETSLPNVPEGLLETPIWMVHGDLDTAVDVESSRSVYRTLAGLGPTDDIEFTETYFRRPTAISNEVRYTEFTGGGHVIWSPIYTRTELYDWMFQQSVIPEPNGITLATLALCGALLRVRSGCRSSRSPR